MRKIVFYTALILSLSLLVHIAYILIYDLDRLTRYGYGFLTGKIILFIVFLAITMLTGKKLLTRK